MRNASFALLFGLFVQTLQAQIKPPDRKPIVHWEAGAVAGYAGGLRVEADQVRGDGYGLRLAKNLNDRFALEIQGLRYPAAGHDGYTFTGGVKCTFLRDVWKRFNFFAFARGGAFREHPSFSAFFDEYSGTYQIGTAL